MEISIKEAFENIKSQRYNKTELFIYFVIILTICILCLLCPSSITNKNEAFYVVGTSLIVTVIYSIFYSGYFSKMCNNEINKKENVIPDIKDIKNTILLGIKYYISDLALSIILGIIPCILLLIGAVSIFICFAGAFSGFAGLNNSSFIGILILGVLMFPLSAVVAFLFYYLWGIPLHLNFFKSLDLSDLFDFKKAIELRKTKKVTYNSFIGKAILFWLIFVGIYMVVVCIFSVLYNILAFNSNMLNKEIYYEILSIIASIFSCTAPLLCFPHLIGQFFNEENSEVKQEEE